MAHSVVILGAGISGLSAAWFLKRRFGKNIHITLIEKAGRAGGWVETEQAEGFLFEKGPRSCRTGGTGRETLQLTEDLGLTHEIIGADPSAKIRYIYYNKQLRPLPRHPLHMPFYSLTRGFWKALWKDWSAPRCQKEDETVAEFFSRRIGKEFCSRLIDPFMRGIYAGDIRQMSIRSCLPLLWNFEKEQGSLLKGAWRRPKKTPASSPFVQEWEGRSLFSFKQGMETLPRTLQQQLEAEFLFDTVPFKIECEAGRAKVHFNNQVLEADALISTLPTYALAPLLPSYQLGQHMQQLSYSSVQVVNLGYAKNVLPRKGFGYLIPSDQKENILGCVWDSSIFPLQSQRGEETRLTVMVGGANDQAAASLSDAALTQRAMDALKRQAGVSAEPETVRIKRAANAIPHYEVGHWEWAASIRQAIQEKCPSLVLLGTAYNGVSMNDCVAEARKLAENYTI
ncbi:MAG: protoporphyrinogen oxidase [Parachlamydia sp.]|jgi:oxygen-dependent protoporphyrinogen oxidase|nr:protoporphyrinogen oxidase [Parachlamydia sp.]